MRDYMGLLNLNHVISDQFAYVLENSCENYRIVQMLYLIEKEEINQKTLAKKLGMTEPALSMKLKLLENDELITKEKSKKDKRHYTLALTQKGFEMLEDKMTIILDNAASLFTPLTDEEFIQLHNLLKKLEK